MRINIHFLIPPEVESAVRDVNASLVRRGVTGISFTQGRAIPHISITMGENKHGADLSRVIDEVRALASATSPLDIDIKPVHLVSPKRRWFFMNAGPEAELYRLKRLWCNRLSHEIEIEWAGRPESEPHITVGYSDVSTSEAVLDGLPREAYNCRITQVGISLMGPHGTCVSGVQTFPLEG